jgi:hypothetical protein
MKQTMVVLEVCSTGCSHYGGQEAEKEEEVGGQI